MNVLKNRLGAKKHSIKKVRVADKKLCEVCQEKYKKNGQSAWNQWERGGAVKTGGVIKLA